MYDKQRLKSFPGIHQVSPCMKKVDCFAVINAFFYYFFLKSKYSTSSKLPWLYEIMKSFWSS